MKSCQGQRGIWGVSKRKKGIWADSTYLLPNIGNNSRGGGKRKGRKGIRQRSYNNHMAGFSGKERKNGIKTRKNVLENRVVLKDNHRKENAMEKNNG